MSESAIRAQIYTILGNVANIGQVYDYERWAKDWATFISLFKSTTHSQIRGWEMGRKAPITQDDTSIKKHTYFIRGYMAVDDSAATEKTFNALIEAVSSAFAAKLTLNSTCSGHDLIQVDALDTRMFGSVMCHFCEMTLTVYETVGT